MIKQILLTSSFPRLRCGSAIVAYLLILILGSIPGARQDIGEVASGLILHSCAYAGLAFLMFTGSRGTLAVRALTAVLTIALMGALDEYVQSFFPYRHGDVRDWMVDCTAAILMSSFMWVLWSRYRIQPSH
ncbi:VanZ family protein [Duganella callida]|uniref:VanZ-like domain-containing protein n=1 Tax=Duganella callida TaxID=2561932 RepID=A0A4Y9S9F6_9BURK|nr:VanZ family protein [Duganella callida]TFW18410.1 hypothetical protein E4L98_18315 [Duganella callida]